MNKVNRVLVIFLALMSVLLWGVWEVLQTEWFADIIAKKVTTNLTRKLGVDVKFERLDFKLYPPASIIRQVKLTQAIKSDTGIHSVEANQVGIYFNVWDFFSNKFTVEKIRIYDAEIIIDSVGNISNPEKRKKLTAEEITKSLLNYDAARRWVDENIPFKINEILLEDTFLIIEDKDIEINKLSLFLESDSIGLKGLFEDINLESKLLRGANTGKHTSFEIDVELNSKEININEISVKDGLLGIEINGNAKKVSDTILLDLDTEFIGLAGDVFSFLGIKKLSKKQKGLINLNVTLKGNIKKPNINFKLMVERLLVDWSRLDELVVSGEIKNQELIINAISAKKDKGLILLSNPIRLYSLKTNKFLSNSLDVNVKNFHTNDALYSIDDILSSLKGFMSGDVLITWSKEDLSFFPKRGFHINKFKLMAPNGDGTILSNDGFRMEGGSFILKDFHDFYFDTVLYMKNSRIPVKGMIDNEKIDISTMDNQVDLEDVGPISKTKLIGNGRVKLRVIGPLNKVKFLFDTDLKAFEVIGLKLGDIKGGVSLDLNSLKLGLIGVEGNYRGNIYGGGGALVFSEKNSIDLNIRVYKGEYETTFDMLKPVVKEIREYFPDISMTYSSELTITGKLSAKDLIVKGELVARDVRYKTEDINKVKIKYDITGSKIDIPLIKLKKELGSLEGSCLYQIVEKKLEFEANLSALNLSTLNFYRTFNLGLNGNIYGELSGQGNLNDFSTRIQLKLLDSNIENEPVGDSNLVMYNNGLDLFMSGDILDKEIIAKSMISLGKNKKRSKLHLEINSKDVKHLLGIISGHNIKDDDLIGTINASIDTDFKFGEYKDLNFNANVYDLNLRRGESTIKIKKANNNLTIKDGKIKSFDLLAEGNGNAITFNGYGSLANKFKIEAKAIFDASLAEMVSNKIDNANGKVRARAMILNENDNLQTFFQTKGTKINYKMVSIPGAFTSTDFILALDGNELLIEKFETNYGKGKITLSGGVQLKAPVPSMNVEFEMENSKIPIFDKSFIVISGKGKLTGDKLPYLGYGNISIYHGEILDSLTDFQKNNIDSKQYNKYIPASFKNKEYQLFNYDVSIDLARPVKIKNNLSELYFKGGVRAIGNDMTPVISGELSIIPGTSKFLFKGHEFRLTEGKIAFSRESKKITPEIKFQGISDINPYEVKVDVVGPSDNVKINLSSEPVLSQEDILSLLTIGMTTAVSKNLDETDRQSVTTIGVGSLLVDQLKLNEGLTSTMGLQLSVLPEISEDETAFLRGRSAVIDSQATKLKTSTKIKIKKKVSEDVDISVSSTVGGTLEQRQEMNINYNINKKFSIEGVYEVNSTDEDSTVTPDSIGADIKYKWKF